MKNKQFLNIILFHISWWIYFICAHSENILGVVANFILYSVLHFYFVSENKGRDFKMMLSFAISGYLIDFYIFENILFTLKHKTLTETFWLFGMWWGFVSCVPYSLEKIIKKPFLGLPLAALFGPLSYWAGEKIGVLKYSEPLLFYYSLHGLFWALLFFILYGLDKRNKI